MHLNGPILLVEDNDDDVQLALRALRTNAVGEVLVARDGVTALDILFGRGGHARVIPRLVLLDLKLPGLSGLEVLRALRADPRTRLLPVVVLTSSREERDVIESYQLGANSYIRKPVDYTAFVDTIRQLGLYWLVWNEAPPLQEGP